MQQTWIQGTFLRGRGVSLFLAASRGSLRWKVLLMPWDKGVRKIRMHPCILLSLFPFLFPFC
ncbi:hypothetical protein I7I48_03421 [Histoplasma ohiense]|nr:hypothetical protein I7I48_03421 [Histoplasma ohiense (nom. inval.)]